MTTIKEKKRESNRLWTEANPEKQKAAIKRWKENNPDKLKIYALTGRANKLNAQQKYRQTEQYKEKSRDYWYRSRYGISLGDYAEMLEIQHGVCKICHKPETAKNNRGEIRSLSVDHNHTTGQARGLLCHNCNGLLGKAQENIMILQNAIFYLEEYKDGVS
jgi:hypothetical protein